MGLGTAPHGGLGYGGLETAAGPLAGRCPQRQGPLCWGQRWSWHEQQVPVERRLTSLVLSRLVDLPGGARTGDVHAAVRLVVSLHEVLRSTFAADGLGVPRQTVWPAEADAYQFAEFDGKAGALRWLRGHMDVRVGWPLRVAVVRTGGRLRLGVATHHLAADLDGFDLLCEQLRAATAASVRGAAPAPAAVGRQPLDLAAFEQSAAGAATDDRAIAYWLRHDDELGDLLAAMRARCDAPGPVMRVARVTSPDAGDRLAALASRGHASTGAVAVAAVACVLARHLGRSSVPLSTVVTNRHLPGLARTVCCLSQSGVLRVRVPDPRALSSSVPSSWAGMVRAMRHAHYDGDRLSERMTAFDSGGRHLTVAPPSITMHRSAITWPGLRLVPRMDGAPGAPFTSLTGEIDQHCLGYHFHAHRSGAQLSIELRTGGHLLSMEECHRLATEVMTLIRG